MVPAGLQGNADVLFGNLHELYTFHSETFLKDLENCISTTELVALCFVQRVSLHSMLLDFEINLVSVETSSGVSLERVSLLDFSKRKNSKSPNECQGWRKVY